MSNRVAISIVPGEVRLLAAKANGSVQPTHRLSAPLGEGAVSAGLHAPNLPQSEEIAEALSGLAEEAGLAGARIALTSMLIPDAAVRMALVPLEGAAPRHAEGSSMAQWALRDLLPGDAQEARIDWSIIGTPGEGSGGSWLLAVGAPAEVIREYEGVVASLGWNVGRVVPLTLALACGVDVPGEESEEAFESAARLVLSGAGGQLACMVEADGVPHLHRAWRGAATDLSRELEGVARYASQRLELPIADTVVAGPQEWRDEAAAVCEALGWRVRLESSWAPHLGAIEP